MILHDGRVGPVEYVVEPVVRGRHPWSPAARVDAALDLVPAVAAAWQGWGPVDRPLSQVKDVRVLRRLRVLGQGLDLRADAAGQHVACRQRAGDGDATVEQVEGQMPARTPA